MTNYKFRQPRANQIPQRYFGDKQASPDIEKGMTGKSKVIRIHESTQDQVMAQLARLSKQE
jgi:uncharacterized protein YggU (UPF0235/DUF167 family)